VVKKVENEEFEPYFAENCCFLKSLKAYLTEKSLFMELFGLPKKPMKEPISPK